ncbi:MAG: PDZ domain-containing protein [Burkholderiales bacterium]|nr:PDZ domain-containing protein [Burkholderiales bacterium]
MIQYIINPQTNKHIYDVTLRFMASKNTHDLYLPAWIPGSYMIREFSKNIIKISTNFGAIYQQNKNTWGITNLEAGKMVEVSYQVYAYEYGIRTAFLDNYRGYFNPTSLCLAIDGFEDNEHSVTFANNLPDMWQVAVGLDNVNGCFIAKDYDELLDMPFEIGLLERYEFIVANTPHYLILSGNILPFDKERIISDMTKVCEYQIKMFGGVAPYKHYTFILNLSGEVYTGLEHRNSTLLMSPSYALPNLNGTNEDDYIKLMGLISHEFFHTWNVKRIKPKVFTPYNLQEENYTKLLWWFEGVTSYYDDLVMYRSGVIDQKKYLGFIIDAINNVYKFDAVNKQSVANSSLTAWIKYYRQDENSPNSIVSYYVKGSLVAMCLDLLIRDNTNSKYSLDDVLRYMFTNWQKNPVGVDEDEIPSIIKAATGIDLSDFIKLATETTDMLPLVDLLAKFGLHLNTQTANNYQDSGKYYTSLSDIKPKVSLDLGMKLDKHSLGYIVKNVYANTPAEKSGIAANDLIIAINSTKLTNLERQINFIQDGEIVMLSLFRQESLLDIPIEITTSKTQKYNLILENQLNLGRWL